MFCSQFSRLGFTSLISLTKKFVDGFFHQVLFLYFPSAKIFGPQLQPLGFVSLLSFTKIVLSTFLVLRLFFLSFTKQFWSTALVIKCCSLASTFHQYIVHSFSHQSLLPQFSPSPKKQPMLAKKRQCFQKPIKACWQKKEQRKQF